MWLVISAVLVSCLAHTAAAADGAAPAPGVRDDLSELLSLTGAPQSTSACPRLLSFGGSCMCAFHDQANLTADTVQFDRHVSGRRELCIGPGMLEPPRCALLSVQSGTVSGEHRRLADALRSFGCAERQVALVDAAEAAAAGEGGWEAFSVRRLMRRRGLQSLHVLDVSVEGREQAILQDVLRSPPRATPRQVALTAVLDRGEAEGEESTFLPPALTGYVRLLRRLRAAGYRAVSYNANPRCVQSVRRDSGLCVPIVFDTTWVRQ